MRVLAIDTALNACSVALVDNGAVLGMLSEPMQRGHAECIAPMVQEVMAQTEFSTIDRIVVTTGPGSFTGVRVGLAFARATALALEVPCVGVSTLEALALENGESGWRGARIAAPRGAYVALFNEGDAIIAPALMDEIPLAVATDVYPQTFWAAPNPAPDIVALARRGALLDPARYPAKPLYLRAPDAKPAMARAAPV
ncbi:MAG TPA: tRNA (adenosine(37)-N6)-threonylcarbamoyltransferase complex dimerization subunit type 1 TsaB [Caulobacterales bacterium]|nr:tRNA (adenosine(37)-N6)-threonylcarbamoyltransferase complex dimerization subunit type 1 TsaB [Caulobacterales bacterium]